MNLLNKCIVLFFMVGIFFSVHAIPDPDKTGIIFINGIWNKEVSGPEESAVATNKLLGLPKGTVKYIHNPSNGVKDVWRAHKLLKREGAINAEDAGAFWRWMKRPDIAPEIWKKKYYEKSMALPSTVNFTALKNNLDKLRESKDEGIVIVSHSEGNLIANALIDKVISDDEFDGKNCMAMVSVATPATRVSNNGPYATFINDRVINGARSVSPLGFSILKGNYPASSVGGLSRHSYVSSYLADANTRSGIAQNISEQIDKVKASCKSVSCGTPLTENGNFSATPQRFTFNIPPNVKNEPQDITFNFEAFHIPDSMVATANGIPLFSTEGLQSGFHTQTVEFDPKKHGSSGSLGIPRIYLPNIFKLIDLGIRQPLLIDF